jgi:hypothetical protein
MLHPTGSRHHDLSGKRRRLEHAQQLADHESLRTTKLYDRTTDEITFSEVERIRLRRLTLNCVCYPAGVRGRPEMWASCFAPLAWHRAGKRESRENACRFSGHVDRSPHAPPRFARDQNRNELLSPYELPGSSPQSNCRNAVQNASGGRKDRLGASACH